MILKGLLVVVSGFIFIFSSGIPMSLISRFRPDYKKEGLYWGIGIWATTFFISNFLQAFIKLIVTGGQSTDNSSFVSYFLGDIITTFLLQIGMLIFLKKRLEKNEDIISDGLALGFGIGMIAHVFTGLSEIGAGAGIVFQALGITSAGGSVQSSTTTMIAETSLFSLFVSLLSAILFRVALLSVSSVQGYLVANSVQGRKKRFWAGIILSIMFTWIVLILQILLGEENPGQIIGVTQPLTSILTSVFYLAVTYLCYRWLSKEFKPSKHKESTKRSK